MTVHQNSLANLNIPSFSGGDKSTNRPDNFDGENLPQRIKDSKGAKRRKSKGSKHDTWMGQYGHCKTLEDVVRAACLTTMSHARSVKAYSTMAENPEGLDNFDRGREQARRNKHKEQTLC